MRKFPILRVAILAAALTVPLARSGLALQEQQSMASQNAATASYYGGSGAPYSNDALMSPTVGD